MISLLSSSSPIGHDEFRQKVFAGDVFVFHQLKSMQNLIEATQKLVTSTFGADDPVTAHKTRKTDNYVRTIEPMMREYSHGPRFKDLQLQVMAECGADPSDSAWCRATIRVQPPVGAHTSRLTSGLGPHRDVWYANLFQQINWWAPIFSLDETRTLALYPYYWKTKIENDTQGWDLGEFRKAREKVTQSQGTFEDLQNAYSNPLPKKKIPAYLRMPIVVEPGDIVCFSAAHLHEGIPNTSQYTRFSTDFRTVNLKDSISGAGAPNIDTHSTGSALGDFVMMDTGQPITERLQFPSQA